MEADDVILEVFLILWRLCSCRNLIIEERSFIPCEDLKYGRLSFRGFNPEVEVCVISRPLPVFILTPDLAECQIT